MSLTRLSCSTALSKVFNEVDLVYKPGPSQDLTTPSAVSTNTDRDGVGV